MATDSSSTITSLIVGWSAILPFPERLPAHDRATNASAFPEPATRSAAAGFFTRCNMIRPTRRGLAITQRSLSGGTPIISQLTCSMVLLLASKACARLRLTARRCSLVVLPTRSPSTSLRPAWAIRIVWFQLVFAPATRHRWAVMYFYYLSTALLLAAYSSLRY